MAARKNFFVNASYRISNDFSARCLILAKSLTRDIFTGLAFLPRVAAQNPTGYTNLNSSNPSYSGFQAAPAGNDTDGDKVQADIQSLASDGRSNDWAAWRARAAQIRLGNRQDWCIGNLSIALNGVGAAYQASAAGATTLLTLLPTAGALIGAPAKELWVLYKLVPLAGVLSMILSLGGNIVPMEVNQYERVDSFSYAGMIGSIQEEKPVHPTDASKQKKLTEAEAFADEVYAKAMDATGSRKSGIITIGCLLQLFWLACILGACGFIQGGAIVVWWCTMRPWMYFWYIFVALSSLLDNLAGVPFTRQYTIRGFKAPKIRISDDAPWVIPEQDTRMEYKPPVPPKNLDAPVVASKASGSQDDIIVSAAPLTPSNISLQQDSYIQATDRYQPVPQTVGSGGVLAGFLKGYNTYGRVIMDTNEPWAAQHNPFYVIISIQGISNAHATLRVFSKLLSIGVFTVGTGMFASSTFVSIMVAVIVATLTLVAGVFGRVTAMWMAAELMQNKPVIHRVVRTNYEADQMVEAMLRKPHCGFEILGHLVIDGRCVKRFRHHIRWSKILGVLASPYDLTKLAMPRSVAPRGPWKSL